MKKHIVVLILFSISFSCSSQVLDYFDNNPVWLESCSFQESGNCIERTDRQIYIYGDTVMSNGHTYKALHMQRYTWYSNFGTDNCGEPFYSDGYYTAIRQSGDTIFQYWVDDEILALHYTLEVGDILEGAYWFSNFFNYPVEVTSIDSIETQSGWAQRYNLYSEELSSLDYLVEGVGHSYGFLLPMDVPNNGFCEFVCYRQNGEYQFGPDSICSIISSVPELSNIEFRVFPNPIAEDFVTIDLDNFENIDDLKATLFSIDGKRVQGTNLNRQSVSKWTLNLGDIASGMYLLTLKSQNGRTNRRLIVE